MKIPSSVHFPFGAGKRILTESELQMWHTPRIGKLIFDLLGPWVQIGASFALVALWDSPIAWIAAFLLIGGAQHGINLITHEFGHALIIPHSKRLNDFLGTWIYGAAGGLPFRFYRDRHWDHHRFVSTDDDTKKLYRRDYTGWHLLREFILGMSGYDYAFQVLSVLKRHKKKLDGGEHHKTYVLDFLIVIFVQLVIFGLFLYFGGFWHYLFLWLLPLVTVSSLCSKLRSSAEHLPLFAEDVGGTFYRGTESPMYRSVRPALWEHLFLTRVNFHYHWEHHLWPTISYQHLQKAHVRLFEELEISESPTYTDVLLALWREYKRPKTVEVPSTEVSRVDTIH